MTHVYDGKIASRRLKYPETARISEILANMRAVKTVPVKESSWKSFMFLTATNEWFTVDILEHTSEKLILKFSPKYRGHSYTLTMLLDGKNAPAWYKVVSPYGKIFSATDAHGLLAQIPTSNRWRLELRSAFAV